MVSTQDQGEGQVEGHVIGKSQYKVIDQVKSYVC